MKLSKIAAIVAAGAMGFSLTACDKQQELAPLSGTDTESTATQTTHQTSETDTEAGTTTSSTSDLKVEPAAHKKAEKAATPAKPAAKVKKPKKSKAITDTSTGPTLNYGQPIDVSGEYLGVYGQSGSATIDGQPVDFSNGVVMCGIDE